jgi:hypothetical protein
MLDFTTRRPTCWAEVVGSMRDLRTTSLGTFKGLSSAQDWGWWRVEVVAIVDSTKASEFRMHACKIAMCAWQVPAAVAAHDRPCVVRQHLLNESVCSTLLITYTSSSMRRASARWVGNCTPLEGNTLGPEVAADSNSEVAAGSNSDSSSTSAMQGHAWPQDTSEAYLLH